VHADLGLECTSCHEGKEEVPHEDGGTTACSQCHEEQGAAVGRSVHAGANGKHAIDARVGACVPCHGVHDVRRSDDPKSRTFVRNVTQMCGTCHGDTAIAGAQGLSTAPFEHFRQSVHGNAVPKDEKRIAVCTSCHGSHLVLAASDAASSINPLRIADTCGACHPSESKDYEGSVHGVAFSRGITAAPTCTSCHGIHSIKHVPSEAAAPGEQRLVRSTCVACHASAALMSDYGPAPSRVTSYQASYHGLARQRGTTAVADCASCHGIHAIYPSNDPRSSVAPAMLEQTCGHCHPGASEEFTRHPVHFTPGGSRFDVVLIDVVRKIYRALIIIVIGGMLLHNAVVLSFYVRRKLRVERSEPRLRRFSGAQIAQHAILLVTFFTLAVTGFALAYPDAWWSRWLLAVGLTEPVRRWIHRGAALVLMATGVYHVLWARLSAYGRAEIVRIAPRLGDFRDLIANMTFHLGASKRGTRMRKYGYPEKLEYWAVIWGTAIMALTGIVLWFPVIATKWMPYWIVKVSEIVHLYEAWLATLAVVVFHLFYVMGHPAAYPLSLSMFTGRMSRREAELRHPEWVAEVDAASGETGTTDDAAAPSAAPSADRVED
jgi:formate dehydrogenase gamma subunit